ncbi:MAG: esterase-like activity of phytase family protein, partial [Sediminibacterium sp.]|nr:esterase-like activity of phytase family protein [Sediminibacterium sp.]
IYAVQFKNNYFLKNTKQTVFPNNKQDKYNVPDPESIRFNTLKNTVVWSSEGERIVSEKDTVLQNPSIYEMDLQGNFLDSFILPNNLQMQVSKAGPRQNGVLEGLSFSTDYSSLYTNVEEPLYEDGEKATVENNKARIRIFTFDVKTKKNIAQYFYPLDAIAHPSIPQNAFKVNGVSEILCIDKNKLWVIERSFSTGVKSCTIKIFEVILSKKNNILQNKTAPILQKKLIFNFDTLNKYIDNIEGICIGPTLSNGNKSVLLISDDNFNDQQITQFYLFSIIP